MSPLRRWMREHGRPGWYSWLVVVMVPLMASVAVLIVSLKVNQRSIERERMARLASEQAYCHILILIDDSYKNVPPATKAGRELAEAISRARTINRCPSS